MKAELLRGIHQENGLCQLTCLGMPSMKASVSMSVGNVALALNGHTADAIVVIVTCFRFALDGRPSGSLDKADKSLAVEVASPNT